MIRRRQIGMYVASAFIPFAIYLLILYILNLAPFGNNTILISDATNQYIDFASYWKSVLSGDNDIFYTFSKTMGGNGYNLAAYYLLSPFNLLFLLSNAENIPIVYTFVVLIKVSMCGLTFFLMSTHYYKCNSINLVFSTSYALMAYNVLYSYHIFWLDGVIILPIIFIGLSRILSNKSSLCYVCALGYALATNFYIGYMLCIASVLFFFAMVIVKDTTIRKKVSILIRFIGSSAVAGFSTAIVWLPTILSLLDARSKTNPVSNLLSRNLGVTNFFSSFFVGAGSDTVSPNVPLAFCGSIILVLVIYYFLDSKHHLKEKIVACFLILFFLFSFFFNLPNVIWHGFSTVNSFNYRYSFVFCFFLIFLAQYQFQSIATLSRRAILLSSFFLLAVLVFVTSQIFSQIPAASVVITFVSILLITLCMSALNPFRCIRNISLSVLVFLELAINCCLCWNGLINTATPLNQTNYSKFVQDTQAAVNYVKSYDSSFYRMEKTFQRSINDPSMFNYAGLSHFSSTEPVHIKSFMRRMGFPSHYNFWAAYMGGSTAEVDSFLGIKYLLSLDNSPALKGYTPLETVNGITIYENPAVLPLIILSNNKIPSVSAIASSPVELHNSIWQGLTNVSTDLLTEIPYSVSTTNLDEIVNPDQSITFKKLNASQSASVRYEIPISYTLPLYYYFSAPDSVDHPDSPEIQDVTICINGQNMGKYFDFFSWNMCCAGIFESGDTVVIELKPNCDEFTISGSWFFYEDSSVLNNLSSQIQNQDLQYTQISSSRFQGTFVAQPNQLLLFTIPFDHGWHLKIDGHSVETFPVLDALLAANTSSGVHEFELYYIPVGFHAGLILTGITLITYPIIILYNKKRRY